MSDDENAPAVRKLRERHYAGAIRVRLPEGAEERIDRISRRSYRTALDTIRYLLLLGLDVEEQRLDAADERIPVPRVGR